MDGQNTAKGAKFTKKTITTNLKRTHNELIPPEFVSRILTVPALRN